MANPFKVIGDSLLGRLVPTWQAKADSCIGIRGVNEGYCWIEYTQCETPSRHIYCEYTTCGGQRVTYNGIC
ncbi:hypothetical protein [Actinospica robiniae]|uniref:hypothetical protein n=1 Tax=Actinospica robiniae TaxID=304901 RepID=UPI0004159945|nr:hypothetical protein [Actinospica robiniae]